MLPPGLRKLWENRWGKQVVALVGGGLFFWGAFQLFEMSPYRILYNDTRSQPRGLYLLHRFPARNPALYVGERIVFRYHCPLLHGVCVMESEAPYAENSPVIKWVGAIPGDVLNVVGQNVYVRFPGHTAWKLLGHRIRTIPGNPPQKVFTYAEKDWHDYTIPPGTLYDMSQRVRLSYDSRYYGLIADSQLEGRAHLLWRVNLNGFFRLLDDAV